MTSTAATFDERWAAAWALRRTDAGGALDAVAELAADARRQDDPARRGRVALLEGSCEWRRSDYAAALRCLMEAADLLASDDLEARAALELDLGTVRNYYGEHDAALEHVLAALRLRDEIGDDAGRADAFNNLGIVFWERRDLEEAERAYRESITIRTRLGDLDAIAASRNNLGKLLTEQGLLDLAHQELLEARRLWESVPNTRGLGVVANNIGVVLREQGQLDASALEFETSLKLKESVHDRTGMVESRRHLGRVLLAQGRTDDALELLALAAQEAERLGVKAELASVCLAMSEIHEARGDAAAALDWYKRFHTTDRAVYDDRSTERLLGLQVSYQLARAEQEGNTDGLTGLLNRRGLDRRIAEVLAQAERDGEPATAALLDLDDFKQVNDVHGHAVGDDVLRTVARLLRDHTRTDDVLARYGGEEFVVLFPATGQGQARAAAQQLCERIRTHAWQRLHRDLQVTVSIGVASSSDHPMAAELLGAADHNLYRAKHAGKDRVEG